MIHSQFPNPEWPPLFWRFIVHVYDYDQSPDWYSWGI